MSNPMRERLIELLYQFKNLSLADLDESELADYLLENGVIVPPCKIGDKVYIIQTPHASLPLDKVVEDEDDGELFHCEYEFQYCPNCGAKMDGRKEQ